MQLSLGTFNNRTILTNVYIKFNDSNIHLALFYERGDFYWTAKDDNIDGNYKWFGDKNRAINRFIVWLSLLNSSHTIFILLDLALILLQFKTQKM